MNGRRPPRAQQMRERIAGEAARIMLEGGIRDFQLAKRKAAERLRMGDARQMPGNEEIQRAIEDYQRIFRADSQPLQLAHLRRVALQAMRLLHCFRPCLVGPVLNGTADEHSDVSLHVFADPPEEVRLYLMERRIPHQSCERRVRVAGDEHARFPAVRFLAGDTSVEALVLPERERRHAPLSPVDGKPMQRASIAKLESLLAGNA